MALAHRGFPLFALLSAVFGHDHCMLVAAVALIPLDSAVEPTHLVPPAVQSLHSRVVELVVHFLCPFASDIVNSAHAKAHDLALFASSIRNRFYIFVCPQAQASVVHDYRAKDLV